MAKNRPNKRQRTSKGRKAMLQALSDATLSRAMQSDRDAALPKMRSNLSSWDRVPAFRGVGYQSFDTMEKGARELDAVARKRGDIFSKR